MTLSAVLTLPSGRRVQQLEELSREAAREAAAEELSERPYTEAQPPLLLRVVGRVLREIGELLDRAAQAVPGGPLGLLLVVALLVGLVAVLVVTVRPGRTGRAGTGLFDTDRPLTAGGHRELAEAAAAQGRYADAIRERLRAMVRELEARGVLDPRPGRTADEVAGEAGEAVPEVADDLARAARVFGEVWYGGRTADADGYAGLVDVDRRLVERRLVVR